MAAHAELARACQVPFQLVPANGDVIRLAASGPELVDRVPAGRLAVEGNRLVPLDGAVVRARERMSWNGAVLATVVLDKRGRLVGLPRVSAPGLADGEDDADGFESRAVDAVADAVSRFGRNDPDERVAEAARKAIRRVAKAALGRRPHVQVHVVRV
jgi:ribonuclease J